MKIRTDFVTNSSSSSYVIAYRSLPKIDDATLAKYPFLRNYSNMVDKVLFTAGENDTTKGERVSSIGSLNDLFIRQYGWKSSSLIDILNEDNYLKERYDLCADHIDDGFNIIFKNVDYSDSYCTNMLSSLEDGENFIILKDE